MIIDARIAAFALGLDVMLILDVLYLIVQELRREAH